jgi:hypothetical protein
MIYSSYSELKSSQLDDDDVVIFNLKGLKYEYVVMKDHLCAHVYRNDIIFDKLSLNPEQFCKMYYKYSPGQGEFPEYNHGDYEAVTRVTLELFRRCELLNDYYKKSIETSVQKCNFKIGDTVKLKGTKSTGSKWETMSKYKIYKGDFGTIDKISTDLFQPTIITIRVTIWSPLLQESMTSWFSPEDLEFATTYVITHDLNKSLNNQINIKSIKNGKVYRIIKKIQRGEEIRGNRISSEKSKTSVGSR